MLLTFLSALSSWLRRDSLYFWRGSISLSWSNSLIFWNPFPLKASVRSNSSCRGRGNEQPASKTNRHLSGCSTIYEKTLAMLVLMLKVFCLFVFTLFVSLLSFHCYIWRWNISLNLQRRQDLWSCIILKNTDQENSSVQINDSYSTLFAILTYLTTITIIPSHCTEEKLH